MGRRLLFVLPAAAALVVLWGVLAAGVPRPVSAVQVLGGPTRGAGPLSLLLRAVTSDGSQTRPLPAHALRVVARTASQSAEWQGQTNASGFAEARLEFAAALEHAPELRVESAQPRALLAAGTPALSSEEWRAGVRRQGGWLPGQTQGTLELRVAPAEGVIAVPFATELVVEVAAQGAGVRVELELEGAEALSQEPDGAVLTDAAGRARLRIAPSQHAIGARVRATNAAGEQGQWSGALPVVPGALHAALDGAALSVRSPIPREEAFVSVVTQSERLAGAAVALTPDESGASGRVALEPRLLARLGSEPAWAVVSSEYDKRSPGVVGWPLVNNASEPPQSFDAADRVLLDGLPAALAAERDERLARRRTALWLLLAIGGVMLALLAYELRSRSGPRELALTSRRWLSAVAIACVATAVAALALFGWLAH